MIAIAVNPPQIAILTAVRYAVIAAVATSGAASAQSADSWYIDVSGSVGYSTSPFLTSSGNEGSAYGEVTVNPHYTSRDERGSVEADGRYTKTFYFDRYGGTEDYGASVMAQQALDPLTSASGSVVFTSAILGERAFTPGDPEDSNLPDVDPDAGLIGIGQRRNLFATNGSISRTISERDSLSLSAGANRSTYTGGVGDDFIGLNGTISYSRTLSQRASVGGTFSVQKISYDSNPLFDSNVYRPQATMTRQINEFISLNLAAGVLFIESPLPDGGSSGLSGNINLCYNDNRSSGCLTAFTDASSSGFGGTRKTTGGSLSASYKLGEVDTVRGGISYTKFGEGQLFAIEREYITANLNWDRPIVGRLSGGVGLSYRSVSGAGFGEGSDFSAVVSLRYRIGKSQ